MRTKIHLSALLSMLCLILPLWCGCSNDMDTTDMSNSSSTRGNYSGTPIVVKAVVNGVENFNTDGTTRSVGSQETLVVPLNKEYDTGFDMAMTIEAVPSVQTRANVVLENTYFRIVAYKNNVMSVANYAGQGDFKTDAVGSTTAVAGRELFLPKGDYAFFCYSFGTDTLPDFNSSSISIPIEHGADFMVYKSNVNVEADAGTTGIFTFKNILFVRQCSRMQIIVTTDGFGNNKINACEATLSNLNDNSVNYDLTSGLSNTGTSGSFGFTWDASALGDTIANSNKSYLLPATSRSFSIQFTELTFGTEKLKGATFTVLPQALVPGMDYRITMAISRNFIPVGGFKWAKGNLYKTPEGEYLIEATQQGFHDGTEGGTYFGWNTLESTDGACNAESGIYSYSTDPCSKLAPEGTWRTPSRAEANELVAVNYEWDAELLGAWMGTESNKVFLPAVGFRSNNGVSKGGVVGFGKNSYYSLRDYTTGFNQSLIVLPKGANWMSRLQRTNGCPIRCVKVQ